ncbi:Tetraketide alpha-pyrone reductase 2 [Morella rubra]|uniref:Tetraketide alpha-pyrone reductase 2 n=1 Tax=Morella rubra TaxID=262757 RepID=A0A6A1W6B9_9ROSI|nr:Tetraketide alpha-pyrone reductase 2 [Morella rubra]
MAEYCVTGGTGLIAAHLVKTLLEQGHIVRTTVRDPGDVRKVGFLLEFNGADQRLKIMKADLMVEGSFDEAVQGVDGVFHTASPVVETLIDPSIKGTLNVLSSCSKASSVKRVVLTSSCSSIRYRDDANQVFHLNESHWSDPEYCKRHNLWYAYAKTLAEKEAWRMAEQSGMDLVVVNPSFVVGPLLSPQPTSSLLLVLDLIKGARGEYPNMTIGFVHIGSVAHWSQILEMLRAKYPLYPFENKCSNQEGDNTPHSMDTTKIIKLGFLPFKTLDQMFDDCIRSFQEKGFL